MHDALLTFAGTTFHFCGSLVLIKWRSFCYSFSKECLCKTPHPETRKCTTRSCCDNICLRKYGNMRKTKMFPLQEAFVRKVKEKSQGQSWNIEYGLHMKKVTFQIIRTRTPVRYFLYHLPGFKLVCHCRLFTYNILIQSLWGWQHTWSGSKYVLSVTAITTKAVKAAVVFAVADWRMNKIPFKYHLQNR